MNLWLVVIIGKDVTPPALPTKAVILADTAQQAAAFTVEHQNVMPGERIVVSPILGNTYTVNRTLEAVFEASPIRGRTTYYYEGKISDLIKEQEHE